MDYLLLKRLQIHNANALSSPYTIGFPAVTAWLGSVHALERSLNASGFPEIHFPGVAVSSHFCEPQLVRREKFLDYSIVGQREPLVPKNSKGNGSRKRQRGEYTSDSFIEKPRCHLCVSVLAKMEGVPENRKSFIQAVKNHLLRMKVAGGDVESIEKVDCLSIDEDEQSRRDFVNNLMPGYVLIERRDLMLANPQDDALSSLMDNLAINVDIVSVEEDTKPADGKEKKSPSYRYEETYSRNKDANEKAGWIVPIAVGFKSISEEVKGGSQRSNEYPHFFAESVVTLGEFRMAYHFRDNIDEMFWHYHVDPDKGLYLCQNQTL